MVSDVLAAVFLLIVYLFSISVLNIVTLIEPFMVLLLLALTALLMLLMGLSLVQVVVIAAAVYWPFCVGLIVVDVVPQVRLQS